MADVVTVAAAVDRTIPQWLMFLALTMVVGMCGQVIRSVAGMKKLNDQVQQVEGITLGDGFEGGRFLRSLLIGGVAGVLSGFALIKGAGAIPSATIFAILAAGYSGADFIEAFMKKASPDVDMVAAGEKKVEETVTAGAAAEQAAAAKADAEAAKADAEKAAVTKAEIEQLHARFLELLSTGVAGAQLKFSDGLTGAGGTLGTAANRTDQPDPVLQNEAVG